MVNESDIGSIPFVEDKQPFSTIASGLSEMPAIRVLKGFASPESIGNIGQMTGAQRAGLAGLVIGGLAGWYVAKRWPNFIVKWVGVIAGANLGVIIAEFLQSSTLSQRR